MQKNRWCLLALVLVSLYAAAVTVAWWRARRPVAAVAAEAAAKAAPPAAKPAASQEERQETAAVTQLKVLSFYFNGVDSLVIQTSVPVRQQELDRFLQISPLAAERYSVELESRRYYWQDEEEHLIKIVGDFAFDTDYTLTLKAALPAADAEIRPLETDFTHTFRRQDLRPSVDFADVGRYLPSIRTPALRLNAVNVTNIQAEVRRVVAENVVQLLAREEGKYSGYYRWGEVEERFAELAGVPERIQRRVAAAKNECATVCLPVAAWKDSVRGIYLVQVANDDHNVLDRGWDHEVGERVDKWVNLSWRHRLVCVSDLALSVRKSADHLGVWVTSLATGQGVPDAWVEVRSAANLVVMEGRTDAHGWCRPQRVEEGEPFAVIVTSEAEDDMTFMALSDRNEIDEMPSDGKREEYLNGETCSAFVTTERGVYRHGERILLSAIVRNGEMRAPAPFPVVLELVESVSRRVRQAVTRLLDASGAVEYDGFEVQETMVSSLWQVRVRLPGQDGVVLGEREVQVEDFVPPQLRVSVRDCGSTPTNLEFEVTAEQLFGAPADGHRCAGRVVFKDVPFRPAGWEGYVFGASGRALSPILYDFDDQMVNDRGLAQLTGVYPSERLGLPAAAVRATVEATVFEQGGRPVVARTTADLHYYPFYLGSTLGDVLAQPPAGHPAIDLAAVLPSGERLNEARQLRLKLWRLDTHYNCVKQYKGGYGWECETTRTAMPLPQADVTLQTAGDTRVELPQLSEGDYELLVEDRASDVAYGRRFYLSGTAGCERSAPLANPRRVELVADRQEYRVGERPQLVVRSPFVGSALVSVLHTGEVASLVVPLTNATSVITLPAVERGWWPNVDVAISVVQSVEASRQQLAACAHGFTTLKVRPVELELPVELASEVDAAAPGGARVKVSISAPAAAGKPAWATVTLVDEGINLLTDEPEVDPMAFFAANRTALRPLYDLFGWVLPVVDEEVSATGVKTGGGWVAGLLRRISPECSKRFKPLALWATNVVFTGGRATAEFQLPEFVGEVRLSAIVRTEAAVGAAVSRVKVSPQLVARPDAPRFVAPGDRYAVTLGLYNRSGKAGVVEYALPGLRGKVTLPVGGSTNLMALVTAPLEPGSEQLKYSASGWGERHDFTLELPVRPAVAWETKAGMVQLKAGAERRFEAVGTSPQQAFELAASPLAELQPALKFLLEYPHGCLEQTVSRCLPLLAAGGTLNAVSPAGVRSDAVIAAGTRRVLTMFKGNRFVMWPDVDYEPWDPEVSGYAAHFLAAASRQKPDDAELKLALRKCLKRNPPVKEVEKSAYYAHNLALAGLGDARKELLGLYDRREQLSPLASARVARGLALVGERERAQQLLATPFEPQSVREAAFQLLALLELDPDSERCLRLLDYLAGQRRAAAGRWADTSENAHALLAMAAYYQRHPIKAGEPQVELKTADAAVTLGVRGHHAFDAAAVTARNVGAADAFLAWWQLSLPELKAVTNATSGLKLEQRFVASDGSAVDLKGLRRGDLVLVKLVVSSPVEREVGDLVIESLLPACFEPALVVQDAPAAWVLRSDTRDDRVQVFSKRFTLKANEEYEFTYAMRVVTAGTFALPGARVEGMYNPELYSRCAPGVVVVRP